MYKLAFLLLLLACSPKSENQNDIITGTVTAIENGKDGYTATLKTQDGENYKATISIPNLGQNGNFRKVEIGEEISIKGEEWQMEDAKYIKVTELLP